MISIKKTFTYFILFFIFIAITLGAWIYSQVDGSLAILTGKKTVWGLTNTATIERDHQGIVTIKTDNRLNVAVALGFVHAQERFFQMDLLRRNSAGELSSLFGSIALDHDKKIRLHRFRERAKAILHQLPQEQIDLLKAYTKGVNQGLAYLETAPFEYLLLQQEPVEWQEEDSILTVFSMYIDLQDEDGFRERTLQQLKKLLPAETFDFLNPKGSRWDAAIDNSHFSATELPTTLWPLQAQLAHQSNTLNNTTESVIGSNNWAVSGKLTQTGSAMFANDMHLALRIPNTWFRARFNYKHNQKSVDVNGLTLPGTPLMVVGSNRHIAWGFTNSYGDFSDVINLKTNEDNSQYLTPQGWKPFSYKNQLIAIKNEDPVEIQLKETIWGPVINATSAQNNAPLQVLRWVAHDKQAVNLSLIGLELANTVQQAFTVAHNSAIPEQNMVIADADGNIGWTIIGLIPERSTTFGQLPMDWSTGEYQWNRYVTGAEHPMVSNPEQQRIWTANARVVGGESYKLLGNGGYALGARAQQIQSDLMNKTQFTERDFLAIALDQRALFLKRWQQLLLQRVLTPEQLKAHQELAEVKAILSSNKPLEASKDSVAYRIVRNFRLAVKSQVFKSLNQQLKAQNSVLDLTFLKSQLEVPLWKIVNQPSDESEEGTKNKIDELLANALIETIKQMTQHQPLAKATWGQQNTSTIKHPLANAIPLFSDSLKMPALPFDGDSYMPRVQQSAFGASERMIVSPGHEEQGILHMPTSQSGHPWSPFFGLGHQDWVDGKASPFLPGKTQYTLTLLSY